ncbi:putative aminopeptidase P, cytoplasmic [Serendipita vermifera]|nr:putative aminopeptidase P, cytoplasmic [Serendipita vermifera]
MLAVLPRTLRLALPSVTSCLRRTFTIMGGGDLTGPTNTTERIKALRALMQKDPAVDAYVIPSEDQHFSEYLAKCDERRAFITGFTGSAGTAIVLKDSALLFTDGRYFLQARQQMDDNWTLMKQGLPHVPTWQEYLSKDLPAKSRIGFDPTLISIDDTKTLEKDLKEKESVLVPTENLVDQVWGSDRPPRPSNEVFPLEENFNGKSTHDKIARLREQIAKKKATSTVVSQLDEVAWLFNLRGSDIPYNPVFFAYATVTPSEVVLFIEKSRLNEAAIKALEKDQVVIKPYESIMDHLKANPLCSESEKVLIGGKTSLAIVNIIGRDKVIIDRAPVTDSKSLKNEVEIEGFRQSHIRDGAALARYFAWLEQQLQSGAKISESEGADKLEHYRKQLDLFMGLSFPTISSTGPNGAIIHYQPDPNDCATIDKDQLYLCDSGAQFKDGTTDVTRTWHFGEPKAEEIRAFTRVLQGHICIDTTIVPSGTSGGDAFARRALWQDGLGNHGTGHGVGHFLNVHEGPQGIGKRIAYNDTFLKPGMTLSNEPGYYADGKFGIRLENIVVVKKVDTPNRFGDVDYLGFEHVTMSPMHRKLIDKSLLTPEELKWVNNYHAEVLAKVGPLLDGKNEDDLRAKSWLERECKPL